MGIYVRFNRYTSCNYSRSLSIYYKTSEVSADCDTSTSVSRCFRNLDNCLLHFHCSVYSSQKLRHLASKCLLLTKQHCLFNRRFYCISSGDFDILPQLTSIFCLLREFNVSASFLKQRSPALTILPKNQPTGWASHFDFCHSRRRSENIFRFRNSVDDLYPSSNCGWPDITWILYWLVYTNLVRCFSLWTLRNKFGGECIHLRNATCKI